MANMWTSLWPGVILSLYWIAGLSHAYDTIYLEDYCSSVEIGTINLGSASPNSSGIIRLSKRQGVSADHNCTVQLQPPLGFGVVLSVRFLNLKPPGYIEIHDKNKPVRLNGYSDDVTEYQSYFSEDGPLKLNYVSAAQTDDKKEVHSIILIATAFVKLNYECDISMFRCRNSRCIWKGLLCDGHNNCGDQSDESSDRPSSCGIMPSGAIAGIVVASVITLILFIICTAVCCKIIQNKRAQNYDESPPLVQPGAHHSSSSTGSIQRGLSTTEGGAYGGYQDMPPPAYKP